jgi:hypothetical protein
MCRPHTKCFLLSIFTTSSCKLFSEWKISALSYFDECMHAVQFVLKASVLSYRGILSLHKGQNIWTHNRKVISIRPHVNQFVYSISWIKNMVFTLKVARRIYFLFIMIKYNSTVRDVLAKLVRPLSVLGANTC